MSRRAGGPGWPRHRAKDRQKRRVTPKLAEQRRHAEAARAAARQARARAELLALREQERARESDQRNRALIESRVPR